jgi:hypothetical protein
MLDDRQITDLEAALADEATFRSAFDEDPVAALNARGLTELAAALEEELASLHALADRLASDDALAQRVADAPLKELAAAGVPAAAAPSFLQALEAPAEVVARAVPEVEAHGAATGRQRLTLIAVTALVAAAGAPAALAAGAPEVARYGGSTPDPARYGGSLPDRVRHHDAAPERVRHHGVGGEVKRFHGAALARPNWSQLDSAHAAT